MAESEQSLSGDDLLRRIRQAPFAGPLLDVSPARVTRVRGLDESSIADILTLLERAYGEFEDVSVRPDDQLRFDVVVGALPEQESWRSAQRLHEIVAFLRSPEGCPWDRAQDWSSLAPKVVEEAYEVVDAIAEGYPDELAGELGDLLLVVALLTQIAEEQAAFTIEDVYEKVNRKLIRRHPHVFGDDAADTPEAVLSTWQRVKREERGTDEQPRSAFDRLPKSMPALAKAVAMSESNDALRSSDELPSGETLLAMIEAAIAAGRNPEAELQAALQRKYGSSR